MRLKQVTICHVCGRTITSTILAVSILLTPLSVTRPDAVSIPHRKAAHRKAAKKRLALVSQYSADWRKQQTHVLHRIDAMNAVFLKFHFLERGNRKRKRALMLS